MPTVEDARAHQSQLANTLAEGLKTLSQNQTITFTTYSRQVLPMDGYIFYLNTGVTQTIQGSIHYAIDRDQAEDATIDIDQVIFTALEEIDIFNQASPGNLYIGTFRGLQFSFSRRQNFYQQANLFHYLGQAVYSVMQTQLIDNLDQLPAEPIVTNSLPIWLGLTNLASTYPVFGTPIFPSFVVPDNLAPPYVVAHIEPDLTEVPSFPIYDWPDNPTPPTNLVEMASSQLAKDKVRLTMYGFNNQQAIQYLTALIQYSLNTDAFGFGNSPAIHDEKRTQVDLTTLAMKKTVTIDAWYYQSTSNVIAQRLILEAGFSSITT